MDILNLHFSEFDFDKPGETKAVIWAFFLANSQLATDVDEQTVQHLVDLVFLAWQQGYSSGEAAQADREAGDWS